MEPPEEIDEVFDPALASTYSQRQLEAFADAMLMEDAKSIDPSTGKARGIKGESPILFYTHLKARARREIQTATGVVDDNLTVNERGEPGMYYRQSPNGRKVNSDEQRKTNGASYYR